MTGTLFNRKGDTLVPPPPNVREGERDERDEREREKEQDRVENQETQNIRERRRS
jgi:hypothetical protein